MCVYRKDNIDIQSVLKIFNLIFILFADILPQNVEGYPATREFLLKVVDILLDFVKSTNDRNSKVLDFHHPADMMRLLDLEIPDSGLTLQQLLLDCSMTLKYQVKTGKKKF
jgi:glutamate decarboxylase